jgi:hypothetical protein
MTRLNFEWKPARRGQQEKELGHYAPFETIPRSAEAFQHFNANLKCKNCGHLNQPFPEDRWRIVDYTEQTATIRRARQVLDQTVEFFAKGPPPGMGGPGGPPQGGQRS